MPGGEYGYYIKSALFFCDLIFEINIYNVAPITYNYVSLLIKIILTYFFYYLLTFGNLLLIFTQPVVMFDVITRLHLLTLRHPLTIHRENPNITYIIHLLFIEPLLF